MYDFIFTKIAEKTLSMLVNEGRLTKLKKIREALKKLKENPRHPGLHTHVNNSYRNYLDKQTFQSYVENKTPSAYKIFWCYGLEKGIIVILAIIPHP
jgi:hypothetical protein